MPTKLDMWISEGGASSQLLSLDSQVSIPLLSGDTYVHDPAVGKLYQISNLDADVVEIQLGPQAFGVTAIYSFLNNGDGTGTFLADFDVAIPVRTLTIIATDDVDNESAESPILLVRSIELDRLNDDLTIEPQTSVWSDTCERLLDEIPESRFHLSRQYTVPYSYNTTPFALRAVTPGMPVDIQVIRKGLPGNSDETQQYTAIPTGEIAIVNLKLGRGINTVTAGDQFGRIYTIIVAATSYASVMCAYAREIYNYSQVLIDEQETAVFSPISTRLAEPLLTFQDLLPDVRSQKTLATKLAIRSLVGSPGKESGVRDLLTALTLSTPVFVEQNPDPEFFEPSTRPLYNSQEAFGGVEAHVWPANQCVPQWLAFVRYINNLSAFKVVSITENEVLFYDDTGQLKRHVFDFTEGDCTLENLALQSLCFEDIAVLITIFSEMDLTICAASYPFDMHPTPNFPVQPVDGEVENENGLDPGFDGYEDFSVTGHWDGRIPLDSQGAQPAASSGLDVCVYGDGHLMVPLLLASTNAPQINEYINASGTVAFSPGVGTDIDMIVKAQFEAASALDVLIGGPGLTRTAGVDILLDGPKLSLTSSLDVAISDAVRAGLDMVISPSLQVGLSLAVTLPATLRTASIDVHVVPSVTADLDVNIS